MGGANRLRQALDPARSRAAPPAGLSLLLKLMFSALAQPVGELVPVRETAAQTHRWRQPLGNATDCRLTKCTKFLEIVT